MGPSYIIVKFRNEILSQIDVIKPGQQISAHVTPSISAVTGHQYGAIYQIAYGVSNFYGIGYLSVFWRVAMSNRRFEMFTIRQILVRMRQGDTDCSIARAGLMGRKINVRLCAKTGWNPVAFDINAPARDR